MKMLNIMGGARTSMSAIQAELAALVEAMTKDRDKATVGQATTATRQVANDDDVTGDVTDDESDKARRVIPRKRSKSLKQFHVGLSICATRSSTKPCLDKHSMSLPRLDESLFALPAF